MDVLTFKLRERLEEQPPGARSNSAMDGFRQRASYVDFLVNGKSLADLFDVDQRDLVGMMAPADLNNEPPQGDQIFNHFKRSRTLLHELTFVIPCRYEFRRVHIYGCPECGDLGCGSVTMQILETADTVVWKRFDNGREDYANYMSSDKSYASGDLAELWQAQGRNYALLDGFGLSDIELDYEYLHSVRNGQVALIPDADIARGENVEMEFPEIGPFEFSKQQYLKAFVDLQKGALNP